MTTMNKEENPSFCIHFSGSSTQKLFLAASLARQNDRFCFANESAFCTSEICLKINGFVWLKKDFLAFIKNEFQFTKSKFLYFDHKSRSGKLRMRKRLLPIWSPYRMSQIDYLGDVIALKTEVTNSNSDFEFENLTREPMKQKVSKSSGFQYVSFNRKNLDIFKNLELKKHQLIKTSIVIPTRGSKIDSEIAVLNLINSLKNQKLESQNVEVVIVYDDDNDTGYLNNLGIETEEIKLKLIPYSPPFNFSKKCNLGAINSSGEVLLFLNDDTKLISENAIAKLSNLALQSDVGAVGAKLYFSNGSIQHGGIVVIGDNVGHAYFKEKNPEAPYGDLKVIHEVSGVTGACLAQRKSVWQELGGWDEHFENSYNDVEYCFRLRDAGYSILQHNQVELFHFESLTRDASFSQETKNALARKWAKYLNDDPFFPEFVSAQKQKRVFHITLRRILKKVGFLK